MLQNRGSTSALKTENIENNVEKKYSATMTSSIKRNENLLTTINNQIKKINNTEQRGNNNNKTTNEENNENEEKRNDENNGDSVSIRKELIKKFF